MKLYRRENYPRKIRGFYHDDDMGNHPILVKFLGNFF